MREFESGATRNSVEGKLSYMRALSPEVLRRYVQYLAKHRQTPKGLRAFDNWKKGIDQDTYCDSLLRHSFDAWLTLMGYKPSDTTYTLEELLCAIIFNAQGWLFELIHAEGREQLAAKVDTVQPAKTSGDCHDCANYDRCAAAGECVGFVPKVPA